MLPGGVNPVRVRGQSTKLFDSIQSRKLPRYPWSAVPFAVACHLHLALASATFLILFIAGCGANAPIAPAQAGNLVVSPASVSFGALQVGQTAASTLSLSNNGSATLQVSQIKLSSQDFSLSKNVPLPIILKVGASYNLTVVFAPTTAGAASATVTFVATGNPSSVAVSLSGTGEAKSLIPGIQLESTNVGFGDVLVNATASQRVIITSIGTAALTVSAVNVAGSGFAASGLTLPLSLNPSRSAELFVSFDPGAAGSATGSVSLVTNAPSGAATIALSGIGVTKTYAVGLTWDGPASSPDPSVGYRIFRSGGNSAAYSLLNTILDAAASYTDSTVQNGTTYSYYVKAVDAQGNESAPSNTFTATIPN